MDLKVVSPERQTPSFQTSRILSQTQRMLAAVLSSFLATTSPKVLDSQGAHLPIQGDPAVPGLDLVAQGDRITTEVPPAVLAFGVSGCHRHRAFPLVVAHGLNAKPLTLILLLAQLLVDILGVSRMARQVLHEVLNHGFVGCRWLVGIRNDVLDDVADFSRKVLVLVLFPACKDSVVGGLRVGLFVGVLVDLLVGDQRALFGSVAVPVAELACGALITWSRIADRN